MYYKFAKFCLSFFDNLNKTKFLKYFEKIKNKKIVYLVDVGAHHGESIKLFSKYFKIQKICLLIFYLLFVLFQMYHTYHQL